MEGLAMSRHRDSRLVLALLPLLLMSLAGCGASQPDGSVTSATPEPTVDAVTPTPVPAAGDASGSSSPSASTNPLVGEWHAVHNCEEIVDVLTAAGYPEAIPDTVVGNGLIPNVTGASELADPADPCRGAIEVPHSHAFSADGQFASFGLNHQQVDAGRYEIVDQDTLKIGTASFTYQIDGDELLLTPDMAALPSDRDPAVDWQWATMVALPGHPWTRVEP
jgi:hypothetical protein